MANLEENTSEELQVSQARNERRIRLIVGIGVFLGLTIGGLQFFFGVNSDKLVGVVLREIVYFKSDGLYRLNYARINLNFVGNSLEIDSLYLTPDSSRYFDATKKQWKVKNRVYEVAIPKVRVQGTDLVGAYLGRGVNLAEVYFDHPTILVASESEMLEKQESPFEISNLFFLISDRLDEFSIHELMIQGAAFTVKHRDAGDTLRTYDFKGITVSTTDFLIDSVAIDKPFQVADISVQVAPNGFLIPESNYLIEFDSIQVSTADERGLLKGLRLVPLFGGGKGNFYDVEVPGLELLGIDFQQAYFEQILTIESLSLEAPRTNVFLFSEEEKVEVSEKSAYELISGYFKQIQVDNILLDSSSLRMDSDLNNAPFQFNSITVILKNFLFDSLSYEERKDHFFIDDFSLVLEDYIIQLPDSIHTLQAEHLTVSSFDSLVFLDSLKIKAHPGKRALEKVNLSLPSLRVKGAYLWEVLLSREIKANTFSTKGGNLRIPVREVSAGGVPDEEVILNFLADNKVTVALESFKIEELDIQTRHREAVRDIELQSLSVAIEGFQVKPLETDPIRASRLEVSGNYFDMPDKNYLHRVRGEGFQVSSRKKEFKLQKIRYEPNFSLLKLSEIDTIPRGLIQRSTIQELSLADFDILKLLNTQELSASALRVKAPKVSIFRSKDKRSVVEKDSTLQKLFLENELLKSVVIDKITVSQGEFSVIQYAPKRGLREILDVGELSLEASNFLIDSVTRQQEYLFFTSDSINFHLGNYTFFLPDEQHLIEVANVDIISNLSEAEIKGIRLRPLVSRTKESRYNVEVPNINLKGININRLLLERALYMDTLLIPQAEGELFFRDRIDRKAKQPPKLDNLYGLIASSLKKMEINFAWAEQVKLKWENDFNGKRNFFFTDDLSIKVEHFELDSAAKLSNERFLYADDIQIRMGAYEQAFLDSLHTLRLDSGFLSTRQKSVQLYNTRFFSSQTLENKSHFDIAIPKTSLTNVSWLEAYKQEALRLSALNLERPNFSLTLFSEKDATQHLEQSTKEIEQTALRFFAKYAVDSLIIKDAEVVWNTERTQIKKILPLKDLSIKVEQINLPRTTKVQAIPFAEHVTVTIPELETTLPDSLYLIGGKNIRISTKELALSVDSLFLQSRFSPYSLGTLKNEEVDWLNLDLNTLRLFRFDWYSFLARNDIKLGKVEADGVRLSSFRDKRLPDGDLKNKPLVQGNVADIKPLISVDSISLSNSSIRYREHSDQSDLVGKLKLDSLNALLLRLGNLPRDSTLTLLVSTRVMEAAKLQARMVFQMRDPADTYMMEGMMTDMDMEALNALIMPLASIRINKGKIENMQFKARANTDLAKGALLLRYKHLKIKVLDKNKMAAGPDELFTSLIANAIIKNKNPGTFNTLRVGEFELRRDKKRSIFNYWAKIFIEGLKSSVGL